jgi:hypothetical protein
MYINIHLCSSSTILTVELRSTYGLQNYTRILKRGRQILVVRVGKKVWEKILQEKKAYIRFY